MTVTPGWTILSVGEWPLHKFVTVSLLKRLRNGRFAPETAVRRFQKQNGHLDQEVVKSIRCPMGLLLTAQDIIVFQGGDDGRGYRRNRCKVAGGSTLHLP
jgi:hypothetical protein